ncbi:MAG TPA: LacI family DNA-binding transcriptional regulator [Solirubrobacterales bacterium]
MGAQDVKKGGAESPPRGGKADVTIFEVAREAGVSITTVSHVFTGNRPVNEETRRRVQGAAERLAYRPRASARALAFGRTMTLAVQFPFDSPAVLSVPYFNALVPALSEAAVTNGYSYVLVPPNPPRETMLVPLVERRGVDGAILLDPIRGDSFATELHRAGIPTVSLGRVIDFPETPRVDQDFESAFEGIAAHLETGGYRRPALFLFGGEMSTVYDLRQAFAHNFPDGPEVILAEHSDGAARAEAERLLGTDQPPDAFICLSELQAAGVYRAAAALGISIPDEIGVIALGDSGMAREMSPPLTALSIFPGRTGRLLVDLIHQLLVGDDEPPPVTLVQTELIPRASSSSAPAVPA